MKETTNCALCGVSIVKNNEGDNLCFKCLTKLLEQV
jgi:hypothetical protein